MRLWRTWPARTRAATLAGIGVIAAGVAILGLTRHTPPVPEVVHGPTTLYSSTANEGRSLATRRPKPQVQASAPPSAPSRRASVAPRTAMRHPQVTAQTTAATPAPRNAGAVSAAAARFPALAHEALAADPAGGTEGQYFARLGNLLNGTPMPAPIPADADHLARAQYDLDRDDLRGAVAEARQVSGPAAGMMQGWISEAEAQLADERARAAPRTRVAQNAPRQRTWPNVMPTEIPPYARQSTGPAG